MSAKKQRMCVLLPCASNRRWAVPQSCLAEILTLPAQGEAAPACVQWRGLSIPVMDFGAQGKVPFRDAQNGTGLIAVILGVRGSGCDYWGLALRGSGLTVRHIDESECQDKPEALQEYSLAAFELDGQTYQVPDLPALQGLATEMDSAASA